jgi:hypothetical protein
MVVEVSRLERREPGPTTLRQEATETEALNLVVGMISDFAAISFGLIWPDRKVQKLTRVLSQANTIFL